MIVGVVADSHDNMAAIQRCVQIFNQRRAEYLIHAGDLIAPFAAAEFMKFSGTVVAVFGNNDGEKRGLKRALGKIFHPPHMFDIGGRKILVAHETAQITTRLVSDRPDMVICGHTHKAVVGKAVSVGLAETAGKDCLFLNPGECCGYLTGRRTAAIVDLDELKAQIIEIPL